MRQKSEARNDATRRVPLLTIKQVCAIDAVATHASLARASAHLNTSQSTLSRSIAEVERILSRRLFQRGWTGMEPTSEGEVVIAHCRRMVSSIDAVRGKLAGQGSRVAALGHYLTWEMLRAADAVRVTGSVSAAAAYLQISQPDVSRALARMTAAVGRKLFRRTRTGMTATKDADTLAALQGTLLVDMMHLPEQLAALSGEVTGRLSVGLLPFSEQDLVVKAFGQLLRSHKHVRLQAVTGSYGALIDGLRQGELDFVLGVLRNPAPYDTLEELHLLDESFALVVRAGHTLAIGTPSLGDLVQQTWIVAPRGTPTRRYFEDWLLSRGVTPPAQTSEIVTFFLAEEMLLHSDAVGLLTYSDHKRAHLRAGLRILPVQLPDNLREIGLTFRKHQRFNIPQQMFVDSLAREWKRARGPD